MFWFAIGFVLGAFVIVRRLWWALTSNFAGTVLARRTTEKQIKPPPLSCEMITKLILLDNSKLAKEENEALPSESTRWVNVCTEWLFKTIFKQESMEKARQARQTASLSDIHTHRIFGHLIVETAIN